MRETSSYIYDHRLANCESCPLACMREQTECLAAIPEHYNGLMIVGEGPGKTDAFLKTPFAGDTGRLLDALLETAELDRRECVVSNATLCLPPPSDEKKGTFPVRYRDAIKACRLRLLTEIQQLQPRVILALGAGALASLTGRVESTTAREPYNCTTCYGERSWKLWGCAKCKDIYSDMPVTDTASPPEGRTSCCAAKYQPRRKVCVECGGKKTHEVTRETFVWDYNVNQVAGGVFQASALDIGQYLEDPVHTYVISTYHPAACLYEPAQKSAHRKAVGGQFTAGVILSHVRKAKRLLEEDPSFPFSWRTVSSPAEFWQYVGESGLFAADLETDNKIVDEVTTITCIGIHRVGGDESIVIDTAERWESDPMMVALFQWLQNSAYKKVWQNGVGYDIPLIRRFWGVWAEGFEHDTMVAHHAIHPDEPHDLHHIGFTYTDAPPWKPPKKGRGGKLEFESTEELHEYCARDVAVTAAALDGLLAEQGLENAERVYDLDMRKCYLATRMRDYGMPVDRKRMLEIGADAQYEAEKALHELRELTGRVPTHVRAKGDKGGGVFNPNSPNHLVWALFDPSGPFKLTAAKYTDKGHPQTSQDALLDHVDCEGVRLLLRYREHSKIKSTFVDGLPVGEDMRLHSEWRPVGTVTGRWSSSPNFQNAPKWIRSMVRPATGRKIVGADFAQLELRIAAALSGDAALIHRCKYADESRKLQPEWDPHSYLASISFGRQFLDLAIDDPTHDGANSKCACQTCVRKHLRDVNKRVIYGVGYGSGAKKVREAIYGGGYDGPPLSLETIENIIASIWKAFPGYGQYMDEVVAEARRTGKVWDGLIGRRREFPLYKVEMTVARNYAIQSTAASIMDLGMWNLYCALVDQILPRDPKAGIMAQVHDAVYVECADEVALEVAYLIESSLSCEIQLRPGVEYMPIPASAEIADNWKDAA